MPTEIITINSGRERAFARCRDVVKAGGVIAFPTDTFYGLGADPDDAGAVNRIFAIKGRQPDQPILLLISHRGEVERWAARVTPAAERLMRQYWPGPLTLVFPAKPGVLKELTGGTGTIGLRVPGNEVTRELLGFLGTALTGTSANTSGGPGPRTAEDVMRDIGGQIDLVLDGGPSEAGKPSTIIDVASEQPRTIREGAITVPREWRTRLF